MLLGFVLLCLIHVLLRRRLPWDGHALHCYVAAGSGIYGAMVLVYWAAQFIPSGWIAVLGGLMPITTGLLAAVVLREAAFTPPRLFGMLLGVLGLAVMFSASLNLGPHAGWGLIAAALSNSMHAVSSVWLKRIGSRLPALTTVTGGIGVTLPAYLLTWYLWDGGQLPELVPMRTALSIVYLAVLGSVAGFLLYYYLLKHWEASRTALVSLLTPMFSLGLGAALNGEPISLEAYVGAALILAGLIAYERGQPVVWVLKQARWPGW
jgi:drug/metabolite transporter (DMT)-like permease